MNKYILYLLIIIGFSSCGDANEIFFEAPFPKKNIDLTKILGNEIIVKTTCNVKLDTFQITFNSKNNLIINNVGDTIFYGKVCKFRGLYYLNQQIKDSLYWISTIKLYDSLIYGLNSEYEQMYFLRDEILKGNYSKLLKSINSDSSLIKLNIDKKELKNYFSNFLKAYKPDTIVNFNKVNLKSNNNSTRIEQINSEDFEFINKVFPNPTNDILNVQLQEKRIVIYDIFDTNGKFVKNGVFNQLSNKIDLKTLPKGIYFLNIYNADKTKKETIKVVRL